MEPHKPFVAREALSQPFHRLRSGDSSAHALPARGVPFVGRRNEVATIVAALTSPGADGPCPTIVVSGEAGVGKSALVRRVQHLVPDPLYLTGNCLDFSDPPSYAPIAAILRDLRTSGLLTPALQRLSADQRDALRWLAPDDGSRPGPSRSTALTFDAVLSLMETLALDTRVVLGIEDMHWADQSTRDLVLFLVSQASDAALTLLITHRDLPAGHDMREPLGKLARLPHVTMLPLAGLRSADVALQFAALAGRPPSDDESHEVMRLSAGNPLFVEAAVDLLLHPAPSAPKNPHLLLAPLERLPSGTQSVLRVASAAGGHVAHSHIARLCDLTDLALESALRPALAAKLLIADRTGYRFRHDLIARLVYDELLLPGERLRLHRRFAETLGDDHPTSAILAFHLFRRAAWHWSKAGEPRRALQAAWKAAQEGRDVLAHPERLQLLLDLLALWQQVPDASKILQATRAQVLHDAVEAAEEAGRGDLGLPVADEALKDLSEQGHEALVAAILERRSRMRVQHGLPGAVQDLESAVGALSASPTPLRARILAQLADRYRWAGDGVRGAVAAQEAARVADLTQDPYALVRADLALAGLAFHRDVVGARRMLDVAWRKAQTVDSPVLSALTSYALGELAAETSEWEACLTHARTGLRATRVAGQEGALGARLAALLADSLVSLGRWDEATEALEHALELLPPPAYRARLLAAHGSLLLSQGERVAAEAAHALLTDIQGEREQWPDLETDSAVSSFRGAWAQESGHDETIVRLCLDSSSAWTKERVPYSAWPLLVAAASAMRRLTASQDFSPLLTSDLLHEWASRTPSSGRESLAWRATLAAELLQAEGVRADHLCVAREDALSAWRDCANPEKTARALLSSAHALLGVHRRLEATSRLREAKDIADGLGATTLSDTIDALAAVSDLTLSSPASVQATDQRAPAVAGLTPRELEVLALVSLGRTNRQIGQELFISAKTVSIHVSRILTKLGVSNRGEAAAEAHRRGLAGPSSPVTKTEPPANAPDGS